MTKILALETSSMAASVAVIDDDKILGEIILNHKKQHSIILMPMIDKLLKSLEMDISEMDCMACSSGPGSFTGLRIGASTCKGLCHGAGKPIIGIPTLDAIAYNTVDVNGIVCPMIDALRNNVYTAFYRWERDSLTKIEDYMIVSVDELIKKLLLYNENIVFSGDGMLIHKEKLAGAFKNTAMFAPPHVSMPRASSVAALALKRFKMGSIDNYLNFAPFYLRKSQAERDLEKRTGGVSDGTGMRS
ncbi:MAG TPA: tRNA (adenosine(37)-N6)-threonylcarbamoyltransferase complex dimerization subunit type 1 TsaB [Clostridiaceae bacterium]|nr:tRNA (adenosine(37)-N6)-threonylcarbamoyltransferase complex dimerization subunit type 1 TsaB [Clostridiaceae bacterium]